MLSVKVTINPSVKIDHSSKYNTTTTTKIKVSSKSNGPGCPFFVIQSVSLSSGDNVQWKTKYYQWPEL